MDWRIIRRWLSRLATILGGAALLAACNADPAWTLPDVPGEPPDTQHELGGGYMYFVYVWECYEDHRVVIHQGCADGTGCDVAVIERVDCGSDSTFERQHLDGEQEPIRTRRWPGT